MRQCYLDMFASAEKAANKTIAECKDLIEQYREDLKTTGLSKGARMVILEDLGKQTELLERLEDGLVSIQQGKISYNHVMAEYRKFLAWCEEFKKHGKKTATYKEKRDALRFLGLTVYIYKKGGPDGRYDIQLAPPQLMQALQIVPKNTDIGGRYHTWIIPAEGSGIGLISHSLTPFKSLLSLYRRSGFLYVERI